jgi:hypothetical protein
VIRKSKGEPKCENSYRYLPRHNVDLLVFLEYTEAMKRNTATLERLVEPVVRTLTPEVAKALVDLRADQELQERMDELAEKCNQGQLTPDEREEYETSIRFGNFIAILQAKARNLVRRRASAK